MAESLKTAAQDRFHPFQKKWGARQRGGGSISHTDLSPEILGTPT